MIWTGGWWIFSLKKFKRSIRQFAIRHPQSLSRIREAAEQAKIKLSTETEVEIALPFLTPDFSFSCKLTRAELENLTRDIIARTRPHCLRALADAKVEPKDLDQVILVGGQTRMPLVRKFVGELFGCAEFEETRGGIRLGSDYHQPGGPQLNTSQNPDEAVALGAAIQAEILSGGFKNVLLLDVTPLSLGLETFGGLMNVLIPRNSTIPVKAGEMFTTAVDNQRSMLIHVLQGERERAKDNWSLGKFTIEFEPAPRGVPRVGVQFEIDANGILHVLARDVKTGREKIVEMKSAVDVDDAAVQQMVEESVEHAFEDLAARRWIEAKLRANETLAATRKALADCADEMEAGYRGEIEAAARAGGNGSGHGKTGNRLRRFETVAGRHRRAGRNHQAAGGFADGQGDGSDAAQTRLDSVTEQPSQQRSHHKARQVIGQFDLANFKNHQGHRTRHQSGNGIDGIDQITPVQAVGFQERHRIKPRRPT